MLRGLFLIQSQWIWLSTVPSPSVTPILDPQIFPAKLLLFGEHVLLLGAPALAVPVDAFGGQWARSAQKDRHHDRLLQLAQSESLRSVETMDAAQFVHDLASGLFFKSNIPTGYGLGSSGALCAAIYTRYVREKTENLAHLKHIFAQMEHFFHGNSSGIDPLTSYVGAPILIRNKTEVARASALNWSAEKPVVFLLDSKLPRRTGPLVEWFLAQQNDPLFVQNLKEHYLPAHEATLQGWLSADAELFWTSLRQVSAFQLEHFQPMIPQTMVDIWEKSLVDPGFTLKICGAGGGGFVLGFARDLEVAQKLADTFKLVFPLS